LEFVYDIFSEKLDIGTQMFSVISYGVLLDRFTKLGTLSNKEIIPLAVATTWVEADDYTFYAGVLTEPIVAKTIADSDPDLKNRIEVALLVLENQFNYYEEDITPDNFDSFVEEAITIVNTNKKNR
jgi:hypothetical protein